MLAETKLADNVCGEKIIGNRWRRGRKYNQESEKLSCETQTCFAEHTLFNPNRGAAEWIRNLSYCVTSLVGRILRKPLSQTHLFS